eukprot:7799327-Heterocapsa_arctica.AAC.1
MRAPHASASTGVMGSLEAPYVCSHPRSSSDGSVLQDLPPALRSSALRDDIPFGAFRQSFHQLWIMWLRNSCPNVASA